MRHAPISTASRSLFADWRIALLSIVLFWATYLATVIGRAALVGSFTEVLANRMPSIGVGILLTLCIYLTLRAVRPEAPIRWRAAVALGASALAAIAQAMFVISTAADRKDAGEEYRIEAREGAVIVQKGNEIRIQRHSGEAPMIFTLPRLDELDRMGRVRIAADAAVVWLFFFLAWSGVYLAMDSAGRAEQAQRRLAQAEAATQAAHVRALRYQVNPHFLFNTLNSLSSLVMTGRNEQAEEMLIALSTFFRTSLSLDPSESITLEREIELQRLYLEIEQRRFPKRLDVSIDVPDALADLRIPALILQPLVENAIKYGVSRTRDPVTVAIAASAYGPDRARLSVFNTVPTDKAGKRAAPTGTGTGLTNVRERLLAHFGPAATCQATPVEGGFRVGLDIPVIKEAADERA
ncbi:sensor histidine kinase [Sphingomicrobium astaxanthinifaciens]|uniref:sensor histidine kinase n=1 Tax=Sphingomicrobium astaxanthinifaciens TaxID=1227949 RepID=UPI001FCB9BEA|nr:histidine kinase [Sphingomicrobium astaxanthinifaciens]MCJ7421876.1 histidine kinase [Sphingomicrobium astaxanthinifaciens]